MAKFNLPEDKNYYTPNTLKTSSGQFFAPTYKTDETYVDPHTGSAYSKVSLAPVNKVPAGTTTTKVKTPATSTGSGSGSTSNSVPAYKSTLDDLYNKVMGYGGYTPSSFSAGTYTPSAYSRTVDTSATEAALKNALGDIQGYEDFQYDLNGDLLYQQAVDNYAMLGQQAMADAIANAAALTGGYGNSYAASVGNQAYQQYITQANNMIPQFQQMALNTWQSGFDRRLGVYDAVSKQLANELSLEDMAFSIWAQNEANAANAFSMNEANRFNVWAQNEQNAANAWQSGLDQLLGQYEITKDYYATLEAMQKASGGSGGGSSSSKTSGKTSSTTPAVTIPGVGTISGNALAGAVMSNPTVNWVELLDKANTKK